MTPQQKIRKIGEAFASALLREIGKKNFAKVRTRNAVHAEAGNRGICASHDFCDANMTMLAAYCKVTGVKEDDVAIDDQAVLDEFNAAWDYAKANFLTEGKP